MADRVLLQQEGMQKSRKPHQECKGKLTSAKKLSSFGELQAA